MKFLLKQILQKIITKKELEDESFNLMSKVSNSDDEEPHRKKKKPDYSDDYKKMISLMVGSHYVSFQPQTSEISFQSKSEKIRQTTQRLIGLEETSTAKKELPEEIVTLSDLPGEPAGDIKRKDYQIFILFQWQQNNFDNFNLDI